VKPRRTYTKIIAEQDGYIASLENECARLEKKIARLERERGNSFVRRERITSGSGLRKRLIRNRSGE
jgi:hypothetical protein